MVAKTLLGDLLDRPGGDPLTVTQAACVLGVSAARVVDMVRLGVLEGQREGERVTGVDRKSLLAQLRL